MAGLLFTPYKILAIDVCWPGKQWEGGCGPEKTTGDGPSPELTPPLAIVNLTEMRKRHSLKGVGWFKLSCCYAAVSPLP